jgi:adenylate kinase family enzyme
MSPSPPRSSEPKAPRRIVVSGNTGVGKSTLAEEIARRLDVPFVELDALFWKPDWQEPDPDQFRADVQEATSGPAWVVAGNYNSRVEDILRDRTDLVVWLDYRIPLTFWRLWRRTWRRWRDKELLWGTNRERMRDHFLTRDSLFHFLLRSHRRRRRYMEKAMADSARPNLRFIRLRTPQATERWLKASFPLQPPAARQGAAPPSKA